MSALSDLLKKAHEALNSIRGLNNTLIGRDGDIVYSKNNVCIHDICKNDQQDTDNFIQHTPGYLTLQCQSDDALGITLILQWLSNTVLERNSTSIGSVPQDANGTTTNVEQAQFQNVNNSESRINVKSSNDDDDDRNDDEYGEEDGKTQTNDSNDDSSSTTSESDIDVEMNGDMITITATSVKRRPDLFASSENSENLNVPTINVIPNTPVDSSSIDEKDTDHSSATTTSGADEFSDGDYDELILRSSSSDDLEFLNTGQRRRKESISKSSLHLNMLQQYRERYEYLCKLTPEQFAKAHNLMFENEDDDGDDRAVSVTGKMRSMRLFFTANDQTSGQLVIATWDSHYKILHFHHGGLDKLAQLLERWNAIKGKALKDGSPSPIPDRQFLICLPKVSKVELDPEEGLYERVSWNFWKLYKNQDGSFDDAFTMRKAIYFAAIDPGLRKEVWPFLLHVYPWTSTLEQREIIRNDLFIEYQKIKKRRMQNAHNASWTDVERAISMDVARTDCDKPYFTGDNNPNVDTMKNILLNYAAAYPEIGYVQGMSDLLAPLLSVMHDETDTYWCFIGLMEQQMQYAFAPIDGKSIMEINLEYLRELLKLFVPEFFMHIARLGSDALELIFVHRWILSCYKLEFPECDTLHIWEACWSHYRTSYFHLFIAIAIISAYGKDITEQYFSNDEILLHFSSLAMHLDGSVILQKARGLLYQFHHFDKLPCTLAGLCESLNEQQEANCVQPRVYQCTTIHGEKEPCPFAEFN
ncbi:unnamed protein product [Litomosoides sigmodontis]|uniref:Rab-GAP TBC domain-containing protein n=1 Tax=Litomosoides sigmodontis TaxID=42156 RepID=A0A3P6UAQ1_LITSI|nr:unnamed protein product [Litomosoides sigmodontis]